MLEIGKSLKASLQNIYISTKNVNEMSNGLNLMVADIKNGKGTAGLLLTDTAAALQLRAAITKIKSASNNANEITIQFNEMAKSINKDLTTGKGPLNTLLKDKEMSADLKLSIANIQKSTDKFNQTMDAIKQSFLFRGYFRKQERKKIDREKELSEDPQIQN